MGTAIASRSRHLRHTGYFRRRGSGYDARAKLQGRRRPHICRPRHRSCPGSACQLNRGQNGATLQVTVTGPENEVVVDCTCSDDKANAQGYVSNAGTCVVTVSGTNLPSIASTLEIYITYTAPRPPRPRSQQLNRAANALSRRPQLNGVVGCKSGQSNGALPPRLFVTISIGHTPSACRLHFRRALRPDQVIVKTKLRS
jgi:hypothetical protein